jgi:peptidyl-prolyl cis-trans isomerase B (cyclophilin B)
LPAVSRRLPRLLASSLAAGALLLAACDDDEGEETTTTDAAAEAGCEAVQAPPPKEVSLARPKQRVAAGSRLTAVVETSCGAFKIALDARTAPKTVSSFVHMAEEGVYDDTVFHRIVPGFVIQGGDPLGTGEGDAGYFVDEQPPADAEYTRGTVAMVKGPVNPPGRSGSQFFVVAVADAGLAPDYALLGRVSKGQDVVERIGELGDPASGEQGTPLATVVMESVNIEGN